MKLAKINSELMKIAYGSRFAKRALRYYRKDWWNERASDIRKLDMELLIARINAVYWEAEK
jgi:hypothetical protein